MSKFSILHISDLHFESNKRDDINIVLKAFLDDVSRLRAKGIRPNLVIFSGDLIQAGDFGYSTDRNDYEKVTEKFIGPLLQTLELETDFFFLCPGNHDVQRQVVNGVDEYIEVGLKSKLVSRDAVSIFFDNVDKHLNVFGRLSNFEHFKQKLANKFITSSSPFYSTHILSINNIKIGIACINSAWRASGGGDNIDYGNLLIGERVIDHCSTNLMDCDIRIGVVHHPFAYLAGFERNDLEKLAYSSFNIWLHGHIHQANITVQQLEQNSLLLISGGCLYGTRDYYNGYSIIEFSSHSNEATVYLREYFDRTRKFAEASAYGDNGKLVFSLKRSSLGPVSEQMSLVRHMRMGVPDSSLRIVAELSKRPKTVEQVFVEPRLAIESEYVGSSRTPKNRDKKWRTLSELLASIKHILFIGKKESGKTFLLHHIYRLYLQPESSVNVRIPVLIDLKNLPKGKGRILKALSSEAEAHNIDLADIRRELQNGYCIVLMDNLSRDQKVLDEVAQFLHDYPSNRYFFSMDEDLLSDLEYQQQLELGFEYDAIYIQPFGRAQIKSLVSRWFGSSVETVQMTDLSESILAVIKAIGVPRTPLIISLILIVIEREPEFKPINKAALVEKLVTILLQEMSPSEVKLGTLDHRNKEDLLGYLAGYLTQNGRNDLDSKECLSIVNEYFSNRGLIVPQGTKVFLEDLVQRGILTESRGKTLFRFTFFAEYFTARHMISNSDFYDLITRDESYLNYMSEIDYLTGIQRNNRELIKLISDRTQALLTNFAEYVGFDVAIRNFDEIQLNKSILDSLPDEIRETMERIEEYDENQTEKEEFLNEVYDITNGSENEIDKPSPEAPPEKLFLNVSILAIAIRNCELIADVPFKKQMIGLCINTYMKLLYISIIKLELKVEKIENRDLEELVDNAEITEDIDETTIEEAREDAESFFRTLLFIVGEAILASLLGSPKLNQILKEEIISRKDHLVIRMMHVFLYADLQLDTWIIHELESILREIIDHNLYRDIFYHKLIYYDTVSSSLSSGSRDTIWNMIADIMLKQKGYPRERKADLIGSLKSRHAKKHLRISEIDP